MISSSQEGVFAMRTRISFSASLLALSLSAANLTSQTAPARASEGQRALLHQSAQWLAVAPHLANPDTAPAAALETAADVLRARRFPEDALDYYGYALAKGGDASKIRNKMGVVRLDLHEPGLARVMFQAAIKLNKRDAPAWNNLGVTEALQRNFSFAVLDYLHAAKLDRDTAVFHANAGMSYFELKKIDQARQQLNVAIKIDPEVMQKHSESGINAEILGRDNYGELCFEMARLFAGQHDVVQVRVWLMKADSSGFDVRSGLREDATLHPYLLDPEVQQMLSGRAGTKQSVASVKPGAL
jgi:tetratricopeptide (TPR) repeat protein